MQMWPDVAGLRKFSHEQLMDLAGNAFAGGAIAAVMTALVMAKEWGPKDFEVDAEEAEEIEAPASTASQQITAIDDTDASDMADS